MRLIIQTIFLPVILAAFIVRLIMEAVAVGFECAVGFLDWLDKQ